MMIEKPHEGRAKIEQDGFDFKIVIPSKKNWFVVSLLFIWLSIFVINEAQTFEIINLTNNFDLGFDAFLVIWFLGWISSVVFVLFIFLWIFFGKEVIRIKDGLLIKEKNIHTVKIYKKSYQISVIRHLKIIQETMFENDLFGEKINLGYFLFFTGGKIRFDYGMRKVRFGIGLNEVEASCLIGEMLKRGSFVR